MSNAAARDIRDGSPKHYIYNVRHKATSRQTHCCQQQLLIHKLNAIPCFNQRGRCVKKCFIQMTNLGTIHGVVLPNCFLPRDGDQQSRGIFFNGCLPSFKQHNTKPTNELMQTSWFQDKFFRKGGDYLLGVGGKEGYNTWTAGNELPLFIA